MVQGGCLCGAVRIESTGEVKAKGICHCFDCRKITGSSFSTNIVVDAAGFSVTKGTPKSFTYPADSGDPVSLFFCGDCGTTIWSETKAYGKTIKVGALDGEDALEVGKPQVELFVKNRPSWLPCVAGTEQRQTM